VVSNLDNLFFALHTFSQYAHIDIMLLFLDHVHSTDYMDELICEV